MTADRKERLVLSAIYVATASIVAAVGCHWPFIALFAALAVVAQFIPHGG